MWNVYFLKDVTFKPTNAGRRTDAKPYTGLIPYVYLPENRLAVLLPRSARVVRIGTEVAGLVRDASYTRYTRYTRVILVASGQ